VRYRVKLVLVGALPLVALSLLAAVYFSGRERDAMAELTRTRGQLRQQSICLTRMQEALAILNSADTTVTFFGSCRSAPPTGKVFVSRSRGVLLIASTLPPAPSGKAYQMWVIPKGGKPEPAGVFQSESDGTIIHIQHGPVDAHADLIAITVEDAAGAAQPSSQPLFAASVRGLAP